jgi:hypothetical protein
MKFGKDDINFGEKSSVTWDTSVKTTKLSPEQMKRLQAGEKFEDILTGEEEVKVEKPEKSGPSAHPWRELIKKESEVASVEKEKLTVESYKAMKDKGLTDAQIKDELKIGTNTLNDFKKNHGLRGTRGQHLRKKNVPTPDQVEAAIENVIETVNSIPGVKEVVVSLGEDIINSPSHYTDGGIETIDYIEAKLTGPQFEGYLAGNVIKYISRYQRKHGKQDLEKAQWYLNRLIDLQ